MLSDGQYPPFTTIAFERRYRAIVQQMELLF